VIYSVEFRPGAIDQVAEFAKEDPDGIRALLDRFELLAEQPRPTGAFTYGTEHLRLHVGFYRVLIQVEDEPPRVLIAHVGRAGA
jgi:mRNA-degrading endonuclease RelE of RelBE toxin-antitoxin system